MKRPKTLLFNTRIARRTLGLFIICAVVPTLFLSLYNQWEVDSLYEQQLEEELNLSAKSFGLLIFERIKYTDQLLSDLALAGQTALENSLASTTHPFSSLTTTTQGDANYSNLFMRIYQQNAIPWDQALKSPSWLEISHDDGVPSMQLHALVPDTTPPVILSATLRPDFLWEDMEEYDSSKHFIVYDSTDRTLYSTSQAVAVTPLVNSSSWSLFLDGNYGAGNWRIEAVNMDESPLDQRDSFRQIMLASTCLALLLATYIGSLVIRRNTAPIEALQQGIRAISENDFSHRVHIRSNDEFEELGDTFNIMTGRLGRHIHAIESLARIDKLILDRLKIEDITQIVLSEGKPLLSAAQIAFIVRNEDSHTFCLTTTLGIERNVELTEQTLDTFDSQSIRQVRSLDLSEPMRSLFQPDNWLFSAALKLEGRTRALLMIEFAERPNSDIASLSETFTDHIRVALANAEWEARLFTQANYDTLSGLPNRYNFNVYLQNLLQQARHTSNRIALYFIDVDNFKSVNDARGHVVGDTLLANFSTRLKALCEDEHFPARLGGDEFVLLQVFDDGLSHSQIISQCGLTGEAIRAAGKAPMLADGREVHVSVSVGIALYPFDSDDEEVLLQHADEAMYEAKRAGKNAVHFYSDIDNTSAANKVQLVAEMRRALLKDEFVLYYQPKVDSRTGSLSGCEALIRWQHPSRGLLQPGAFIPLAEETSLVHEIGRSVLARAAEQQARWLQAGINCGRLAINISAPHMVQEDFCRNFVDILDQFDCPGSALEIELTETAYVEDVGHIRDSMQSLCATGVRFTVDDYGTGHSSLSLLLNLPLSTLKIDKSFIDEIHSSDTRKAIVESTVSLARKVGLSVVAEGVETREQLDILTGMGCTIIQGYYYSRPVPAEELERMVSAGFFNTDPA